MKKSELKNIVMGFLSENASFEDDVAFKQKQDPIKKYLFLNNYSTTNNKEYNSRGSSNSIIVDGDTISIRIKGKMEQQIPSWLGDAQNRVDIAMFIDRISR
jgi:metal-dependent HD superfamily phosphatase/phosphodiesterase